MTIHLAQKAMIRHRLVRCTAVVVATVACALPAMAADISWINSGGGVFSEGMNWDGGVPPGAEDHAVFDIGAAAYTVQLDANVVNRDLSVMRDAVTLDLGGHTYELPYGAATFGYARVGTTTSGSTSSFVLTNGTLTCRGAAFGGPSDSTGAATITMGATLIAHATLYTAAFGNGTLTVENGGRAVVKRTVHGSPNFVLLSVAEGAGSGSMIIRGAGSSIDNEAATGVGSGTGVGTLIIEDSGRLTDAVSGIAVQGGTGHVFVRGAGSSWISGHQFFGHGGLPSSPGRAFVTISDGGLVRQTSSEGTANIAWRTNTQGTVVVTGAGSRYEAAGTFVLAGSGTMIGGHGTLTISSGGAVDIIGTLLVWDNGRIHYNGGSLTAGAVDMRGGSRINLAPGADKVLRTGELSMATGSQATIDIADNAIAIDYSGASPLASVRALILSGRAGGQWNGPGITSSLADNIGGHGIGYAEASTLSSIPSIFGPADDTAILIRLTRYGDADLNGIVNLADFNRLAANFGATGALWHQADFNYDGLVNLTDFNLLAANFGLEAGPDGPTSGDWSTLASAVPEPAALVWIAMTIPLLTRRRHGMHQNTSGW